MDVVQLIMQNGMGGAALVMFWQFKREIREGLASIREVLASHEARISKLEKRAEDR